MCFKHLHSRYRSWKVLEKLAVRRNSVELARHSTFAPKFLSPGSGPQRAEMKACMDVLIEIIHNANPIQASLPRTEPVLNMWLRSYATFHLRICNLEILAVACTERSPAERRSRAAVFLHESTRMSVDLLRSRLFSD